MTQKWLDAAKRYQGATKERMRKEREEALLAQQEEARKKAEYLAREMEIASATSELQQFINSDDGRVAMTLLAASKRHIIFGEEASGGYANVVFVDGNGLQCSYEPHGMWMAYANKNDLPTPKISPVTPEDAIHAAVHYAGRSPREVLAWLRKEIDKIAETIELSGQKSSS